VISSDTPVPTEAALQTSTCGRRYGLPGRAAFDGRARDRRARTGSGCPWWRTVGRPFRPIQSRRLICDGPRRRANQCRWLSRGTGTGCRLLGNTFPCRCSFYRSMRDVQPLMPQWFCPPAGAGVSCVVRSIRCATCSATALPPGPVSRGARVHGPFEASSTYSAKHSNLALGSAAEPAAAVPSWGGQSLGSGPTRERGVAWGGARCAGLRDRAWGHRFRRRVPTSDRPSIPSGQPTGEKKYHPDHVFGPQRGGFAVRRRPLRHGNPRGGRFRLHISTRR